jgi:hypothetical protein
VGADGLDGEPGHGEPGDGDQQDPDEHQRRV